jgi:hypothetical protein
MPHQFRVLFGLILISVFTVLNAAELRVWGYRSRSDVPSSGENFVDLTKDPATASDVLSFGVTSTTVDYIAARAQMGRLSSRAVHPSLRPFVAVETTPDDTVHVRAASAIASDTLTFDSSVSGGFILLDVALHGTLYNVEEEDDLAFGLLEIYDSQSQSVRNFRFQNSFNVGFTEEGFGGAYTATPVSNSWFGNGVEYSGTTTVMIPFSGNQLFLSFALLSLAGCREGSVACGVGADFFSTATFGNARLLNTSMQQLSWSLVSSASGYAYGDVPPDPGGSTLPPDDSASAVPEPATMAMASAALGCGALLRSRRRRRSA